MGFEDRRDLPLLLFLTGRIGSFCLGISSNPEIKNIFFWWDPEPLLLLYFICSFLAGYRFELRWVLDLFRVIYGVPELDFNAKCWKSLAFVFFSCDRSGELSFAFSVINLRFIIYTRLNKFGLLLGLQIFHLIYRSKAIIHHESTHPCWGIWHSPPSFDTKFPKAIGWFRQQTNRTSSGMCILALYHIVGTYMNVDMKYRVVKFGDTKNMFYWFPL